MEVALGVENGVMDMNDMSWFVKDSSPTVINGIVNVCFFTFVIVPCGLE